MDETGFPIGGQTQWLHVICMSLLAAYRFSGKRGAPLSGVSGIVVHDPLEALLRDGGAEAWPLQRPSPAGVAAAGGARRGDLGSADAATPAPGQSRCPYRAAQGYRHSRQACGADRAPMQRNRRRRAGLPPEPVAVLTWQEEERRKRPNGHNLALRQRGHKSAMLRLLTDLEVGFMYNEAQRDHRKLRQQTTGCFRSAQGGRELRHPAQKHHHRQKAGLEHPRRPDEPIRSAHRHHQGIKCA